MGANEFHSTKTAKIAQEAMMRKYTPVTPGSLTADQLTRLRKEALHRDAAQVALCDRALAGDAAAIAACCEAINHALAQEGT